MKGLVIVLIVLFAGVFFWGWSKSGEASKLNDENAALKKQLTEATDSIAVEKANLAKAKTALADTETKLNIVAQKTADLEKQLKPVVPAVAPVKTAPVAAIAPVAVKTPAAPNAAQLAENARMQQLKTEISTLKQQSLALTNRKTELQRQINNAKNKLMSSTSIKTTGWYYLDSPGYIHPISQIKSRDMKRRIQYVSESKQSVKDAEAAKFETELASVLTQKSQIESQITQKQTLLDRF